MAIQLRASSSFSSVPFPTRSYTHDVFLSFRGEDTRSGFTGHLYRSLDDRGIKTFIDDKLPRGEEISQELLRAIEGSKLSLIVFSENYAFSKWCLDELVHILGCRRSKNQMVRPIFYKVDPSDVRHQRGKFGEAVAEHELRFKDDMDKVLRWRAALSEAANLAGWHFSGTGHEYEYEFIARIIEEISAQEIKHTPLNVAKFPVGIESRVQDMLECLDVGGSDVRMVGIWGSGGIGKTTIAKAVYNTIVHEFEDSCFLANVRERSVPHEGLVNLQNIILSKILGRKEPKVINVDEGINLLREGLKNKRILLILDDVNKANQLDTLAGAPDWFGRGSRIIITTRDQHLLTVHDVNPIYKARELDHHEGCELFRLNAFKNKRILDDNERHLVSTIVRYAQRLPLALVVLGSHLCGRPVDDSQAMLDAYKRNLPKDIQDILKVSYDGLEETEKEVFLDIACFFKGWNTNNLIQILEACDRNNSKLSIKVLEEKALINVDVYGFISMHDLLEEMGKYIVRQESKDPGERSRLWHHMDVRNVLTGNTGTKNVEGIMIKMPTTDVIRLSPKCFKKMKNLKIFINVNGRFCGKVDYYPNQLRLLDWRDCPLQSLPSNFNTKNLVRLSMHCSHISRFGEGFKSMENLKSLNLRQCESLVQSPDLSGSPNLEFLNLSWCERLEEVHPSVGSLKKLVHLDLCWCKRLKEVHPSVGSLENLVDLDLHGCSKLRMLPGKVNWRSLQTIHLDYCSMLESFPEIVGEMKDMRSLSLTGTAIKTLPSSTGHLINLESLVLYDCGNLTDLPCRIELQNLKSLKLKGCGFLRSPDLSGCPNLEVLDLRCDRLEEVHPSVGSLEKLVDLNLGRCSKLRMLPGKVNWRSLKTIKLDGCRMLESFPEIMGEMKDMTSLTLLDVGIKALPSSIRYLINLERLVLDKCGNLTDLPCSIYELQKLKEVTLYHCPELVRFPNKGDSEVLPTYSKVSHDEGCSSMEPHNLALRRLTARGFAIAIHSKYINEIASSINEIVNLRELDLSGCTRLVEIPELPPSIRRLDVSHCVSLERISKLSNILERKESQIMIEEMDLTNCWRLCQNLVQMANKDDDDEVDADLFFQLLSSQQSKFTITFPVPRSEVPKWFSCQMDFMGHHRFEFCIETLANFKWDNTGLALCVAVDQKLQHTNFEVHIHINEVRVSYLPYESVNSAESDHVWLHYVPFLEMWRFGNMRPLPPFTCRVIIYEYYYKSIKSCGVHLVMPPNEDVCMKLIRAENLTSEISDYELTLPFFALCSTSPP
ncbi:disease resistance protein RPV1 [Rosa sericea]